MFCFEKNVAFRHAFSTEHNEYYGMLTRRHGYLRESSLFVETALPYDTVFGAEKSCAFFLNISTLREYPRPTL